jgi:hypothetical protein
MTSRLASALALLTTVAACAPTPPPPVSAPVTVSIQRATGRVAPAVADPGPQAMIWTLDDQGTPTTRWLAPAAASGGYREIGAAPELLIAAGPDVWRWSTKTEHVATVGCDGLGTAPGDGSVTVGFVERLGSAERFDVVTPAAADGMNEINQSALPAGSVGPYLFVRERMYAYGCGAHGSSMASLTTWDLESRSKVDLLAPAERAAMDRGERVEAQRQLPPFAEPLKPEDVDYKGTLPRYGARGWLHFEHAFTTFACYTCGDGAWGSYSVALNVPARHLPERASAHKHAPPVVAAWLGAHPGTTISGWSEVSPPAAPLLAPVFATTREASRND